MTTARRILATGRLQVRCLVRWMISRDMPEVTAIEAASFDTPWTEEEFIRCLRLRNCIGHVAEVGEKVVGYFIYELHKSKFVILNLAVDPEYRRAGVGSQMVAKLKSKLASHRRTRIVIDVADTNDAAHLFLRANWFLAADVLRGQYGERDEYRFEYEVEPEEGGCYGR